MVFNDSRVRKARIYGIAEDTGAEAEFLLLRRLPDGSWEAAATKLKKQRPGRRYVFPEGMTAVVLGPAVVVEGAALRGPRQPGPLLRPAADRGLPRARGPRAPAALHSREDAARTTSATRPSILA